LSCNNSDIESKSAKKPGRDVFNEMMSKVHESKEPIGLIAWHPDRLARNSVDGGQIIYSIDISKIVSLRFPTFWFEPTPQGLFMLQVAFGQSKYYSDNLSENVKRGIRQKLRRGEWPGLAPFGYVNNPKTRTIEPEPTKSRCVTKAFEEFSQDRHTLESLGQRLSFWGVVSGT
jgi:DNA invertase Pin-like site-specific DNA recombinase